MLPQLPVPNYYYPKNGYEKVKITNQKVRHGHSKIRSYFGYVTNSIIKDPHANSITIWHKTNQIFRIEIIKMRSIQ